MKKLILGVFSIIVLLYNTAHADQNGTKLMIKISGPLRDNRYFLCLYDVGCLSLQAGAKGKEFIIPNMDLANIKKFVIADTSNMKVYMQPTNDSCHVSGPSNQPVKITGKFMIKNTVPHINELRCHIG